MTVVSEGPLCVRIYLNKWERKKYFVFENRRIGCDPSLKPAIKRLLKEAAKRFPFDPNGRKRVAVLESGSGGCLLKITALPNSDTKESVPLAASPRILTAGRNTGVFLFAFSDFEMLLQGILPLSSKTAVRLYQSSVYQTKHYYYLSLILPLNDYNTALHLQEFCDFSAQGRKGVGLLQEHSLPLIETNAVARLAEVFFRQSPYDDHH